MTNSIPVAGVSGGLVVDLDRIPAEPRTVLVALWERGAEGVERNGSSLTVDYPPLWALPDGVIAGLGIRRLDQQVDLLEAGLPGGPRYAWHLRWPEGTRLDGCWLQEAEGPVLLPPELVELTRLAERVAGARKVAVFRAMLRLQRLAATCPLIQLPPRIAESRVREVGPLRIGVEGPADDPRPVPQLVEAPSAEVIFGDDRQPPPAAWPVQEQVPEQRANVDAPLDVVLGDIIVRSAEDSVIPVGRHDYLVVPKGVYQDLVLTTAAAEQPVEVRRRFVENPTAFLPDTEAFDEAHYSSRVVGVREAPRSTPTDHVEARTWAEPIDGLLIDVPGGSVWVPGAALPDLANELRAALDQGRNSISWDGREIPARPDVVEAVERAAAPSAPRKDSENPEVTRPLVLRIRENEVVLDWAPIRGGGRRAPRPELPPIAENLVLQPHQQHALACLQDLWVRGEPGALLCDDMGLGKTLQALLLAAWVHQQLRDGGGSRVGEPVTLPVMVVGPPSLLEGWLRELGTRLAPGTLPRVVWGAGSLPGEHHGREIRLLQGFRRDQRTGTGSSVVVEHARLDLDALRAFAPDVLLIGYDTLRSLQFAVGELRVGLVVADEAQEVKNPGSLRSHALRAMNYDFALVLTGTPIENTWSDLWTLCDFATPGLLGPLAEFRRDYPSSGEVREVGQRLADALRGVLIRRTRQDALRGLPRCDIRSEEQEMPSAQALAYRAEVVRSSGGGSAILGLLQGLARVSLHPRVRAVLSTKAEASSWLQESARTVVLHRSLLRWQAEEGPVLVFVRSLAAQETLARALKLVFDLRTVEILNGQPPPAERQRMVKRFADGSGFRVLLVSPDVGGAGWNLQFAARSVLLERPFNPAVEAQMIARTWRLGQSQPVEVVAPVAIMPGIETFDQVLDRLLRDKREIAESVLAPATVANDELAARFGGLARPQGSEAQ